MTDPSSSNDSVSTDPAVKEEDLTSASWWLTMLLFLVPTGIFVFKWWLTKSEVHWLLCAAATLVVGIMVTPFILGISEDDKAA